MAHYSVNHVVYVVTYANMHISLLGAKELTEFLTISQFFSMYAISQTVIREEAIYGSRGDDDDDNFAVGL